MEMLSCIEYGPGPAALLLLIGYHVCLYRRVRHDPLGTPMVLARRTRKLWVQAMMRDNRDILALQTLRNRTMAAAFPASVAILIGLGIFNLAVTADRQGELPQLVNHFGSAHRGYGSAGSSCPAPIFCSRFSTSRWPCAITTTPAT